MNWYQNRVFAVTHCIFIPRWRERTGSSTVQATSTPRWAAPAPDRPTSCPDWDGSNLWAAPQTCQHHHHHHALQSCHNSGHHTYTDTTANKTTRTSTEGIDLYFLKCLYVYQTNWRMTIRINNITQHFHVWLCSCTGWSLRPMQVKSDETRSLTFYFEYMLYIYIPHIWDNTQNRIWSHTMALIYLKTLNYNSAFLLQAIHGNGEHISVKECAKRSSCKKCAWVSCLELCFVLFRPLGCFPIPPGMNV